jgi:hypothetical protein
MRTGKIRNFETPRDHTTARKQLSPWAEQAKAHWKEHRPRMYAELEKAGTLDEAAEKAATQTKDDLCSAIEDGMDYYAAWEMLRERYLFLPTEEDVPLLGENPNHYDSF